VQGLTKAVEVEKLNKVKEYMLKAIDDDAKTNNFWIRQINRLRDYGVDFYTDYKKTVEAQTPETIMTFVKELLKSGDKAEVIMLPEE